MHQLQYQYPVGIHTAGHCPVCAKPARGSVICRFCVAEEIKKRPGVDPVAVDQLMNARAQVVNALAVVEKLQEQIKASAQR